MFGDGQIDDLILVDQSPVGKSPRSNPVTYTGVFTFIRDLFAKTPEARARGYKTGRFSFNVKGGRCEACRGDGIVKIEMHFLPNVYVTCDICHGKRYNRETLEIKYKGRDIAQILDMTVNQCLKFFKRIPSVRPKLQTLVDVGLGYIKIGQPGTTLSGGEAQRIRLASQLGSELSGVMYILDEPSIGLHPKDDARLLDALCGLRDLGNTVIVVEHDRETIERADHVVDFGPGAGATGGLVVSQGTPAAIARKKESVTGRYLSGRSGLTQ